MPKAGDDPSERLLKGEEWEKTGVFAPQNRKKLGICAGLTVVIGAAAAFVVVMDPFGSDDTDRQVVLYFSNNTQNTFALLCSGTGLR